MEAEIEDFCADGTCVWNQYLQNDVAVQSMPYSYKERQKESKTYRLMVSPGTLKVVRFTAAWDPACKALFALAWWARRLGGSGGTHRKGGRGGVERDC